jgi:cytochrome c-type biogenesis protein CcmE
MERIAVRAIWKLAVSAALVGGVLVFLGRGAVTEVEPYKMVDELVTTELSRWEGRELKVHGWVVAGSIVDVWQHQPTTSFVLQKGGKQIRVIATTPSTWLLRPQMELVVQGRLVPASSVPIVDAECAAHDGADPSERCGVQFDDHDYVLVASALNGKCPCKYDGAHRNECLPPPSDRFL